MLFSVLLKHPTQLFSGKVGIEVCGSVRLFLRVGVKVLEVSVGFEGGD